MSPPSASNFKRSDKTVATAPPPKATSRSEADYLREQAANAKAALAQTLGDIRDDARAGVSLKGWTEEHPWAMVSSAAAAGFLAAYLAVPSERQAALRRLARLHKALYPEETPRPSETNGHSRPAGRGLKGWIATELIRAFGSIAAAFIAGLRTPPQTSPEGDPQTDAPPDSPEAM